MLSKVALSLALMFSFLRESVTAAEEKLPIVILLNGTSSAGKSSIAAKLSEKLDEPFLKVGFDWYADALSLKYVIDGEKAEQGYKFIYAADSNGTPLTTIKTGPLGKQLDYAAHRVMKVFLENKFNLIVDEVLFEDDAFQDYLKVFEDYRVYFIAIKPPVEVAEKREISRGDRVVGVARGLYNDIYTNKIHDLEIDSSKYTPEESAKQIIDFMHKNPSPAAFKANKREGR